MGAYPVVDSDGTVRAVVIVEKSDIQAPQGARAIVRAEVRPVVMSVWVGSVVAAFPGLAVAVLLAVAAARSVGGRIRDVAGAAESLAGGSLESRVPVRGEDEVASLAGSFNLMAERLQETMASVEAERARAVALLDANRQLVANVSHELRTPVALIRGQVEALEDESPGNPRVEMALRETARLESLVSDLFQLASAEAGALRFDIAPVDLAVVVRESIAPLVELARRDARVAVALEAPQAVLALADSGRLARVIQNLVRNAIRHVPEGGMVRGRRGRFRHDGNHFGDRHRRWHRPGGHAPRLRALLPGRSVSQPGQRWRRARTRHGEGVRRGDGWRHRGLQSSG
ncbi:MAG: HAMP domain-containing histidine kinase [Dehalococcoidia bacterium]|nr:HAMP domain-containing histidine kinase [Dehalococcoidia bacterium]